MNKNGTRPKKVTNAHAACLKLIYCVDLYIKDMDRLLLWELPTNERGKKMATLLSQLQGSLERAKVDIGRCGE